MHFAAASLGGYINTSDINRLNKLSLSLLELGQYGGSGGGEDKEEAGGHRPPPEGYILQYTSVASVATY